MNARRLSARDYLRLKGATADLLDANGGETDAAGRTRVGQTDLSRYQSRNPDHALRFMPIDVVADLEQAAGAPLVTRILAEMADCLLVPLPRGGTGEVAMRTGRSAKEFGDVMTRIGLALADGTISEAEASDILTEIRECLLEFSALAEAVRRAAAKTDEAE